jgi:hypothetical protein
VGRQADRQASGTLLRQSVVIIIIKKVSGRGCALSRAVRGREYGSSGEVKDLAGGWGVEKKSLSSSSLS